MIHVVIGTKAQVIKMGPLMAALDEHQLPWSFVFTGQHRETVEALRKNFNVRDPDVVLYDGPDVTSAGAMLAWAMRILARAFQADEDPFRGDRSGIVLVHGDTFSCLLGAMLARARGLRVGHVESGLRSHRWLHPFPEELTRRATFALTDVYFCPGEQALRNVASYGGTKVNTVHNTLLDALRAVRDVEVDVDIPAGSYCLASVHRFENIYRAASLERIVRLIELLAEAVPVLFILHPPTEARLRRFGLLDRLVANPRIELRPRYDYATFIALLRRSEFLATDGGSNQEECFYLGKPCLLLRAATERKEGLGRNVVLSHYDEEVVRQFRHDYGMHSFAAGDFQVSPTEIIVDALRDVVFATA